MNSISPEAFKILKYINKHSNANHEELMSLVSKSRHQAYSLEDIAWLHKQGYIHCHSEMMLEGYQLNTYRITPSGKGLLRKTKLKFTDSLITKLLAIVSLILSIISLLN